MNFIRGVLVTLLFAGLAVFVLTNDSRVIVNLWGVRQVELALALVIAAAFLIGFLPMWLKGLTERTMLKRRIARLENQLGSSETALAQARTELLRPADADAMARPVVHPQAIPQSAPPPGT